MGGGVTPPSFCWRTAMSRIIIIAAATLAGGTVAAPVSLAAGRELTPEIATALGLDDKAVQRLLDTGALAHRTVEDAMSEADLVDGISMHELYGFLDRLGIAWSADMSIDQLLQLDRPAIDIDAEAKAVEDGNTADEIEAALTALKVPYAKGAKKAELARLLAQVRAVTPAV
jgi:hypothetical protein